MGVHIYHKTTHATMKIALQLSLVDRQSKPRTKAAHTYSIFKLFFNHPKPLHMIMPQHWEERGRRLAEELEVKANMFNSGIYVDVRHIAGIKLSFKPKTLNLGNIYKLREKNKENR